MLDLPDALVQDIQRGRVVLMLGAGASLGATNEKGQQPPTGNQLRDALADRFLGGKYKSDPLSFVGDLAISETSLVIVQDFIAEMLQGMHPTEYHKALTTFSWRGIATINYDLIMENAYNFSGRIQNLVPCISDRDHIDEKVHTGGLAYLKLHGCITRTHDPELPLILTVDQYVTHKERRKYLFDTFAHWACEYPIIFIGTAGQDPDLRALLLEASRDEAMRSRHYLLKPGTSDTENRFWETKRISTINGTLEEFINTLNTIIPKLSKALAPAISATTPISKWFVVKEGISALLHDFLQNDIEYVHESIPIGTGSPTAFYKGFDLGWYPTINKLDVPRRLADTIMNDVVLQAEKDRPTTAEFYLIKAEAGAGKSVLLRRLAWDASTQANSLCVYLREFGVLRYEGIKELYRVSQQRLFVFIDNAVENSTAISTVLSKARRENLPITIISAERANIWNVSSDRLATFVNGTFELRYLNPKEIEKLVSLLSIHGSLGPHLTGKSTAECEQHFTEQAGRQLLVALHEATMGVPFEQILVDEYNQIQPLAAQQLYLTICVLNRLGVPVRAGLIARVHGVKFDEFRERFFYPLEHVVKAQQHPGTGDYLYTARHPEIAQIVFERILRSTNDRFNEYIRIITHLNLAYSTDRDSMRGLLRAKALNDLFPNYGDVKAIFEKALLAGPHESYIYHQQANYERIRPNGNLQMAERLLEHARKLDPRDVTLLHTLAEVKRMQADAVEHRLEREKLRNESRSLLRAMMAESPNDSYAVVTMIKLAVDDYKDVVSDESSTEREIDSTIRKVDELLMQGLRQFPDETHLHLVEADFSKILKDDRRTYSALRSAFKANNRDTYIASRFARVCEQRGEIEEASSILHEALQANRGDQNLNFQYAEMLRRKGTTDSTTLKYHYMRAFTKLDNNFEAQFWYARFAFESSDPKEREESKDIFKYLRTAPISYDTRQTIRDIIQDTSGHKSYFGAIVRVEYTYAFIQVDGSSDWIFLHKNGFDQEVWSKIWVGIRMKFNLGFSFSGVSALNSVIL